MFGTAGVATPQDYTTFAKANPEAAEVLGLPLSCKSVDKTSASASAAKRVGDGVDEFVRPGKGGADRRGSSSGSSSDGETGGKTVDDEFDPAFPFLHLPSPSADRHGRRGRRSSAPNESRGRSSSSAPTRRHRDADDEFSTTRNKDEEGRSWSTPQKGRRSRSVSLAPERSKFGSRRRVGDRERAAAATPDDDDEFSTRRVSGR